MQIDLNPIQGQISRQSGDRQIQTQFRSPQCKEGPLSLKEKTLHSVDKSPSSDHTYCLQSQGASFSLPWNFSPQQHQGSPPLPGLGLGPHQHLLHFLEPEPLQKADICKFRLRNRNIKQKEEEKTGSEIVERRNDGCRMLEVWLPGSHLGYRSNPDMCDISTRRSIASI